MRRTVVLSIVAASVAGIILTATGALLSSIYHKSQERSFDHRLDVSLRTLIADVTASDPTAGSKGTPTLGDPRFELPLSGWYWQITPLDMANPEVRSSRSLWDRALTPLRDEDAAKSADGARHGDVIGPTGERLRQLERTVDFDQAGRYLITVAGDSEESDDEMRSFDRTITVSFNFLAALLALIMAFQIRLLHISSASAS